MHLVVTSMRSSSPTMFLCEVRFITSISEVKELCSLGLSLALSISLTAATWPVSTFVALHTMANDP